MNRSLSIRPAYAASLRDRLDVVAREQRYLAHVEVPPIEYVEAFVGDNASGVRIRSVTLDSARVAGWAHIVPHRARGRTLKSLSLPLPGM